MQKRGTMLIVDDVEINRAILAQFFQDEFQLEEASNGREALDIIQHNQVDIVLLDLQMPIMTGMEVLNWLQESPHYNHIPVIVTTSAEDERSEVMAMERGAADYMTKPYHPTIVRCRVYNVLGRLENEERKIQLDAQDMKINEMQQILDIDQLTGLYTKKAFLQKAAELMQSQRSTRYCILHLDIANFKVINELFNSETGDNILRTAATYFNTIVGKRGLACHLSADNFALCIPEDILDMELLIQGIDAMMHSMTIYRTITFYAGIYIVDNAYLTTAQMLDRAHTAMNSVERQHSIRYAFYDDQLRASLMEEQLIAREMETALEQGQFSIRLQPIYSLTGQSGPVPVAAEALLRWEHPQQGMIRPDKFIPVFEKNGFITRIDRFAWDQACHFLSRQRDWGLNICPVSVNISYMNIYDMSFVDYLLRLVRKYDLQPWMLWLEITERAYIDASLQLLKILRRLKSCGFTVILDDFGSGYSSLGILKELNVNKLKIDIHQLYNRSNDQRAEIILESVISMAIKLNMEVIAEGVETPEQVQLLKSIHCNTMQGFHFAHPLTSDEYIDLLAEQSS